MKTMKMAFKQRRTAGIFAWSMRRKKVEQAQVVVVVFALCSFFMMTSFGITFPTFAHLFKETSSGAVLLSVMALIPHMTLFVLAPLVGNLADRYGRYPFLVLAFAGLIIANVGNMFAHTPASYIGISVFQAIACVGARPAMMGILASIVPEQQRTRQLSIIMTGFAGGLMLGPLCGGFLLQHWGTAAPFGMSACFNIIALFLICTLGPTTISHRILQQETNWRKPQGLRTSIKDVRLSLVLPLSFFVSILLLDFMLAFSRTLVEPRFVLYITKVLLFSPVQLGLLLSGHGLAMSAGTLISNRLDNRVGKQIAIAGGFLMQALFTFSLLFTHQFILLLLLSLLSGIGGGLVLPLLGTCYLDSVKADHQSRISGIKEAVGALGGILGSLPVILASHWLSPQSTFVIGGCIIAGGGLFAMRVLKMYHASPVMSLAPTSSLFSPLPHSAGIRKVMVE